MKSATRVQNTAAWAWMKWKGQFIVIAVIVGFLAATPRIWPGGWGIGGGESVITSIEKDPQGKIVKETEVTTTEPGKSLWDGLSLLGVPLSLALLGAWFQSSRQKQAADDSREEVLQVYFDRISALLVDENLMGLAAKEKIEPEQQELLDTALDIIRARTLSILRRFEEDIERKSSVIRFLAEAEIVSKLKLNLSGADLKEAALQKTNLKGAKLSWADLQKASLQGAFLQGAFLKGTKLIKANLDEANLEEAYFDGANLTRVNLEKANLHGTNLHKVNLKRAYLHGACLNSAYLYEAYLYEVNLYKASLKEANLQKANLEWAKLYRANLEGVNLQEANLEWAKCEEANLAGANLQEANLTSANLWRANLEGANLYGANLEDAKFHGVNLAGANLAGANFQGVNLSNIQFDAKTIWPAREEVAKAIKINDKLKKKLGILSHSKWLHTQ